MKTFSPLMLVVAGALLSGCATGKNGVALDAVGPQIPEAAAISTNGTLVVYSAYEVNADFYPRDPNRPEYSDYRIFTNDGKLLKRIHNNTGTSLQDPVSVELVPGKYNVVARANGYGDMTVPVVIEARENTVLHLEGDVSWPNESAFNQTNAVRLPDGQIIGWKAASNL